MYRSLDPARIVETGEGLQRRIGERFPDSGLSRVSAELVAVTREAGAILNWLARPHLWLRIFAGLGIAGMLGLVIATLIGLGAKRDFSSTIAETLQGMDAALNEIVFLGAATFFLLTLENRLKRRRALAEIHVLRSLAHIIDMHQLTKDPERVGEREHDTASSPKRSLTPFELERYLDYCSEMLSLISKVAAVYVQRFDDPVTLSAVNEVEQLTNGLSRKIWQKIMIVDRIASAETR